MTAEYYIVRVDHRPSVLPVVAVCGRCQGEGCSACRESGLDRGTADGLAARFRVAGRELIAGMFANTTKGVH